LYQYVDCEYGTDIQHSAAFLHILYTDKNHHLSLLIMLLTRNRNAVILQQ